MDLGRKLEKMEIELWTDLLLDLGKMEFELRKWTEEASGKDLKKKHRNLSKKGNCTSRKRSSQGR